MYPFSIHENLTVFWCFHGVEKGSIGSEWVNLLHLHATPSKATVIPGNLTDFHY